MSWLRWLFTRDVYRTYHGNEQTMLSRFEVAFWLAILASPFVFFAYKVFTR